MRRSAAIVAGLVIAAGGFASSAQAATASTAGATCGPVTFTPGGLTANITCTYIDGYKYYGVKVRCPNYGWRFGPIVRMGQPNYAACLSSSAGEGPVQEVRVYGA